VYLQKSFKNKPPTHINQQKTINIIHYS